MVGIKLLADQMSICPLAQDSDILTFGHYENSLQSTKWQSDIILSIKIISWGRLLPYFIFFGDKKNIMPRKIIVTGKNVTATNECSTKKKENVTTNSEATLAMIQKMHPDKINFSIAETASMINVSYDFVREKIKDGTISAIKYGDRMMIGIFELTRILTEGV